MTSEHTTPTHADSPSSPLPIAHFRLPPPKFNALLWDLLDPTRSAIDIANDYDLSLDELARVLESDQYEATLALLARINAARQRFLDLESPTLAKARLLTQLREHPTTATERESQRKSASTLLPRPDEEYAPFGACSVVALCAARVHNVLLPRSTRWNASFGL